MSFPFLDIGMKIDLFPSCGHWWVFQICWHIECSTFTASSFRIWNSSTGIPSPPLALFIVTLPKAHLTSHSRMSGSRWMITPSWLSGLWRPFLYSSSVCDCLLFLDLTLGEELTHLKRSWCWERLRAGGEGDDRGWDDWMASPTQWIWVWVNSGHCWWTGMCSMLRFTGLQRIRHD